MKQDTSHLDSFRVTTGEGATNSSDGCKGNFKFKLNDAIVQVSFDDEAIGGWEHAVAVAFDKPQSSIISRLTAKDPVPRTPTNEEIMYVKRLFWEDEESVCEIIPAKGNETPWHHIARHLWKRTYSDFPMPVKQSVEAE